MQKFRGRFMSMRQRGFSLIEVLIATAISSLLLVSASRFLPGLQRAVLLQSGNACSPSVNIFSAQDIVPETVRDKGW